MTPNPAVNRTCAKSRAGPVTSTLAHIMSHPHKLPTYRRMLLVLATYVVFYGAFLWVADLSLKDVSSGVRLRLSQYGVFTVYVAGLLAGLGFFWSSKARENAQVASQKISVLNFQQKLLADLQAEQGHQFQERIEQLVIEQEQEQRTLAEAQRFPNTLEQLGFVSLLVLAAGTMLQLLGLS